MKTSEGCREDAMENLMGAIFCGIVGFISIAFTAAAHLFGAETRGGWLWEAILFLLLFGGSLWGFIGYFNDKKSQREFEKEEEEEKQRLTIANKQ
jgi:hypothetical protein